MAVHYYDKAVARHSSTELAPRSLEILRRHHNAVKRDLIQAVAREMPPGSVYVDLACGRGGDILKCKHAGVVRYVGLDCSEESVREARLRYLRLHDRRDYRWEVTQNLGKVSGVVVAAAGGLGRAGAVACMFGLHYFFHDRATVETLLADVAAALTPGTGIFFGVVTNGRAVFERLQAVTAALYDDGCVRLTSHWPAGVAPPDFGAGYTFALRGTIVDEADSDQGAQEFLVFESVLQNACAAAGLDLTEFRSLPPSPAVDPAEMAASQLYSIFRCVRRLNT